MRFCDKLPKLRKNNNLSQEQLAEKLGVSRQAVSKWEAGSSYPDMDKIMQICKILDCKLEDLLDDGVVGENQSKETKINFNSYLQDFLKFVTKTYNMLTSMTLKEKIKCISELFVIAILLLIIGGITFTIINSITYNLLSLIPFDFKYTIQRIVENIYDIILIILGVIIEIHLFKIRYLDYFITIEDPNVDEKTIEEDIEKRENKNYQVKNKEKIIIRDPKHSSFSLINLLGKLVILGIKFFAVMFAIPVIFFFVGLIVVAIISICHINYGIIFLFITLGFVAASILCLIVMYFIYYFIFNREIKFKQAFVVIIISLIVIGISIGLTFTSALSYKQVGNLENIDTVTKKEIIDVKENTYLYLGFTTDDENIEYNIDNSLDKAILEITTIKGSSYKIDKELEDNKENYYLYNDNSFTEEYNLLLRDLKKKQYRNTYSSDIVKVKINISEQNYNILHNNHEQITNKRS